MIVGDDQPVPVDDDLTSVSRARELQFAQAQRLARVGSWEWDIATDTVTWSDELYRVFGLEAGEQQPTSTGLLERLHPDDRPRFDTLVARAVETSAPWSLEHRVVRPDGEVRHVEGRCEVVLDNEGVPLRMHGTVRDRTDSVRVVQRFEGVSNTLGLVCTTAAGVERAESSFDTPLRDPLTGLYTRTVFLEQAERALALVERTGSSTAILSVDLDGFHRVNDDHGRDGGDAVLVEIAERLTSSLRQHDTKARGASALTRVGGDEFLLMCERVRDEAGALLIGTRLLDAIAQPIELSSGPVTLTASIGISIGAQESSSEQMVLDAEAAQRHAKERGGAQHQLFDAEHHGPATAEAALAAELRTAVAEGQLRLMYQPKISLATNRIVGVEALLRWEHPERGMLSPADFIPAAELSDVIVPIGGWVVREACRQAASWRQAYPRMRLQMAVNVSARQFRTGLVDTIRDTITESGIEATALCLEMTETTVMDDIERTVGILAELKELGLTVAIDDFGTGYSSLEYLHRMPIDEVKIDRSFVAGLGTDAVNTAIVASVVSLAHAMGLEVVAEGVEQLEQLERLRMLGCDFAQGYLIARPLPAGEIDEYLAADAAGQQLPRPDPSGGVISPSTPETVLVVDDAEDVRMLAKMSLTAAGLDVEEAGNGAAGLALARRIRPDCVLLDVSMPDMTGIDVCRALRADPATAACTIVMLTAHANSTDKAEAFLVGADDYIVKPFTPRDLVARIRTAVHRRQMTIGSVGEQVDSVLLEMLQTAKERELAQGVRVESEHLSGRQMEILKRLLGGERVPGIARDLYLSQSTVRNHLSTIYQRLGVHSQEGLLSLLRNKSDNLTFSG